MSLFPAQTVGRRPDSSGRRLSADAFADAFVAHSRALWCIAAGVLVNRDQVEDVLQEGALIALGKLDQFDAGSSFLAWMGQIVRYVALNHGRRRYRSHAAVVDPATLETVAGGVPPAPAATTGRGELIAGQGAFDDEVFAALQGLGETARSCVLLRTLLEMPYREIAIALGIPEGTAMSHVHRSRQALRERLKGRRPAGTGSRAS